MTLDSSSKPLSPLWLVSMTISKRQRARTGKRYQLFVARAESPLHAGKVALKRFPGAVLDHIIRF